MLDLGLSRLFSFMIPLTIPLTILAASSLSGIGLAQQDPAQAGARPNLIFVFSDDHAAQAIGAYGSKLAPTPELDRLAEEGVLFENAFVTNSICAPSRAVVLTGRHSHLNGVLTNAETLDGTQTTFPQLLQRAGYQTALIGKWHLKSDPTGFDHYEVLRGQGPYYNPVLLHKGGQTRHQGYTTDIITQRALRWLDEDRDPSKPFLLCVWQKAPHRHWQPAPRHLTLFDDFSIPEPPTLFDDYAGRASPAHLQEMTVSDHLFPNDLKLIPQRGLTPAQRQVWDAAYGPKNALYQAAGLSGRDRVRWQYQRYLKDYLRCITAVDENIGILREALTQRGLLEKSVLAYSSDQGFYLGEHGWYDKRWMYEESLRTPLIVRLPGKAQAGKRVRAMVQNLDYAPTFLELAGAKVPSQMQGLSMLPLLRAGDEKQVPWRRSIYYQYYEFPGAHMVRRHYGVRTERFKLIHYYNLGEWELFDLQEDPRELRSVHAEPRYAEIRKKLEEELRLLRDRYQVPEDRRPVPEKRRRVRI
jgi:arylsulfatase A-like enzyme